jgi:hypothetical protein
MFSSIFKRPTVLRRFTTNTATTITSNTIVSNGKKPACINCVNYIEYTRDYPYDELYTKYKYGKCAKFGTQNLVSGIIEYEPAAYCRKYETQCGADGKYFKPLY